MVGPDPLAELTTRVDTLEVELAAERTARLNAQAGIAQALQNAAQQRVALQEEGQELRGQARLLVKRLREGRLPGDRESLVDGLSRRLRLPSGEVQDALRWLVIERRKVTRR